MSEPAAQGGAGREHEELTEPYERPDLSQLNRGECAQHGWVVVYCPWCGEGGCVNPTWHGCKCWKCKRSFTW